MKLWEMTSPAVAAAEGRDVVLLPIGSVEQHSYHLPTGTDALLCQTVAARVESLRPETVLLAPPIWYGASGHHLGFPGTASVGSQILVNQIVAVVTSLVESSRLSRFFILNGHGGNEPAMQMVIEQLRALTECEAYAASYWNPMLEGMAAAGESWPQGMGHACDLETSMMLEVAPDLVDRSRLESDARTGSSERWLFETRGFKEMTSHGGIGDPTGASAERGRWLLDLAVEGLCSLLDRIVAARS